MMVMESERMNMQKKRMFFQHVSSSLMHLMLYDNEQHVESQVGQKWNLLRLQV